MPQSVINRVNELAVDQPRLLTFANRHGNHIRDIKEMEITPPETPHKIPGVIGDTAQIPGVDTGVDTDDDLRQKSSFVDMGHVM